MTVQRDEEEVRRWATVLIGQLAVEPIPLLGDPAWVAAGGPVRLASAVRAAVAWLEECDAHRLAVEVEGELEAFRLCEEGDYEGWRRVARQVRAMVNEPTHAELQRRRAS